MFFRLRLLAVVAFLGVGILATGLASADDNDNENEREAAAIEACNQWIEVVDAGSYQGSWDQASKLFQSKLSADLWIQVISASRSSVGKFVSREIVSADYYSSLAGAPAGEYYVIKYLTLFENSVSAVETVSPVLEGTTWKVSGYLMK